MDRKKLFNRIVIEIKKAVKEVNEYYSDEDIQVFDPIVTDFYEMEKDGQESTEDKRHP